MPFVKLYDNIKSFAETRHTCPFCQTKLAVTMTNFTESNSGEVIMSWMKNEIFEFDIRNSRSSDLEIKAHVTVSAQHNTVSFKLDNNIDNELLDTELIYNQLVRTLFDDLKMHIELVCVNSDCDTGYYLASLPIYTKALSGKSGVFQFFNPEIYMEAFSFKKFWIQNDWDENKLRVFNKEKSESIPLVFDIIEFDSMPKDKLIYRLTTMVNFS